MILQYAEEEKFHAFGTLRHSLDSVEILTSRLNDESTELSFIFECADMFLRVEFIVVAFTLVIRRGNETLFEPVPFGSSLFQLWVSSLSVNGSILRLGLPDRSFDAAGQLLELLFQVCVFLLQQGDLLAQKLVLRVDIMASCEVLYQCVICVVSCQG